MRELVASSASAGNAVAALRGWWEDVNESPAWQDGAFFSLSAAYALVSAVALIQLIRIQRRVPEFGWTTQKVFHLMNFVVNGVRAVVFGFHFSVFLLRTKVYKLVLLDLPGLLFFSTYTLLVLFWAEIYHQARSLPTDKLRIIYIAVNSIVYVIQVCIWVYLGINDNPSVELVSKIFIVAVSFVALLGFSVYSGRLFFLLRRFPIESKGRRKKLYEVRTVFIDGLSPSWDEDRVKKYLKKYGAIEKIELARNMPAARRKDFGFVTFDTHNNAVVCADGITNCEIGEGDNKAKVRARLSRPIQRPPRMKHGLRGNFRIGHSAPRGGHFPYAHCPPPRRPPPRIVRPDVSRLPPIRSRPLKRPIDIRDRRPVMSIPDRVRRMPPLERSYDRRPPAPVYPKRSPRREYGRHDELPPPRSRAFNLHAVFKEVMSFIKPIAAIKKLSVAATLSPDLPLSAIGDEKRLMQTILNICGNAVKFTKEGHISLLASIVKSDSLRDFRTAGFHPVASDGHFYLKVQVKDTGCGISPQDLPYVFTKFAHTQSECSGRGLGLAVCKRFVSLMEGHIWLDSDGAGKGCTATFVVKLGVCENTNAYQQQLIPLVWPSHGDSGSSGPSALKEERGLPCLKPRYQRSV